MELTGQFYYNILTPSRHRPTPEIFMSRPPAKFLPNMRLFVVWGSIMSIIACGKPAPQGGSDVPPSQVRLKRNVELVRAEQRSIQYYVDTVGVIEAEGQARIAAGIAGIVDKVLFREGQKVDPKTVLVTIDQRRFTAAAEVARANEKRAEESVALKKDVADRARRGAAGSSQAEIAQTGLELRVAQAELDAAKASRTLTEHNLERSSVHPPYAGQINQRLVSPGDFVEDKTIVATMANVSRLRLVGSIPEKATPTVRQMLDEQETGGPSANIKVEFTLQPFPKRTFHGRMFYLSTVANPDTHQFEFKAEVDLREHDVEVKPGYTATIRVPLRGNKNACVVPEEAVRASERGFIAFTPAARTNKDGQTEWFAKSRSLELGYRTPGWVEVLKGINPGDWIVRKGSEALEDGTPINVPEAEAKELKP